VEVLNINRCCFIAIFEESWSRVPASSVTVIQLSIRYRDSGTGRSLLP